ncbi:MAG: SDR family NAD(P)-dependent oxidoreductase [Candidatus Binataceae bacterium]
MAITRDATDEIQVKSAVVQACETFGGIDILVNNAVIFNRKGVLEMPLDEWRRQLAVMLDGAFLLTKRVAQSMVHRGSGGSIINIISTAGHQGEPHNIGYCTGKSGLLNFTRSAAMELVRHGIRVNSLTPTATDPSESFERAVRWGRDPSTTGRRVEDYERFRARVPTQKLPQPRDFANAAVFLASDDAQMITGTDLRVDGGAIARYWAWDPSSSGR